MSAGKGSAGFSPSRDSNLVLWKMSQASLLVCHSTFNGNPIPRLTCQIRLSAPLFLDPFLALLLDTQQYHGCWVAMGVTSMLGLHKDFTWYAQNQIWRKSITIKKRWQLKKPEWFSGFYNFYFLFTRHTFKPVNSNLFCCLIICMHYIVRCMIYKGWGNMECCFRNMLRGQVKN